jgi:hypothetical protein
LKVFGDDPVGHAAAGDRQHRRHCGRTHRAGSAPKATRSSCARRTSRTSSGQGQPYGVYDLALDEDYVSVGIDADTAQFAVASIRSWWHHLGRQRYPHASTLTITADCGGSNGNRRRLWTTELQGLADETGLRVKVCHFPPGTST